MSGLSTHVLDASVGRPASGVGVVLEAFTVGGWAARADAVTDEDGRVTDLFVGDAIAAGTYRLTFATGEYFASRGVTTFYPEITVTFEVSDPARHHHVPLLVSPYGYTTYRGS